MAQNITSKQSFSNRGLVQKIDVNQLAKDQYSFLLNMVSTQEGSLRPRNGYYQNPINWGGSGDYSYAHTISLSRYNSQILMYIGEGTNIRRTANLESEPTTGSIIATGVNSGANRSSYIPWYPSSATGSLVQYFATGDQMLGDITPAGVLTAGVNKWGIKPPLYPTACAPSSYSFKDITTSGTFNGSYSYASTRVNDTVATVTDVVATSGANGYYKIVPTSGATTIDKILPGMYLKVGSQNIRVDVVDATTNSFSAYFGTLPAAADSILGYEFSTDLSGVGAVANETSGAITSNLAFNGVAADGFDTQDNVHISLRVMTPLTVSDVRLRLQCGGSVNDYYERSILPSVAQQIQTGSTSVTDQTNAQTAGNEYGRLQSTGVYGQVDNLDYQDLLGTSTSIPVPDNTQVGLQPSSLAPAIADTWSEIDIPKTSFLKVGRAGQSGYTWAEVTAVQIIVKPIDGSSTATVRLGSIYAYGGNGLNSNRSANLLPYDYVYTYVNTYTQAESNPSQISSSSVYVVRQAIGVKVTGTDNTGQNSGVTKISVYRRGGAFTDGLYRFVGNITNPGASTTAIFEDSVEDISIIGAKTAFFDNNPPVLSSLPILFDFPIASVSALGSNIYQCTLTVPIGVTVSNYITTGTQLTLYQDYSLSNSIKEQRVYAISSGAATITAFFETAPVAGQNISAQAACNRGCDVGCSAFDRIWLAGDTWNPHILYSSKTGNPESWPVIGDGTGLPYQFTVTSPDDPIMGLVEFRNQLIILCRNDIYAATFDRGQVSINKTPAARGMITKGAYGIIDNELWFLSYDGIYSWSGGAVTKRTLAIDPMFNNQTINDILPIDYDGTFGTIPAISFFCIAQKGNDVFANFMNTDGYFQTIRYNLLFDRWSIEEYYNNTSTVSITRNNQSLPLCSITAMAMDYYTGNLWTSMTVTSGGSTTAYPAILDHTTTSLDGKGGRAIYYQADTAAMDMGDFTLQKIFTDIALEITVGEISGNSSYYIKPYYDYLSTANAGDTFEITPLANGRQLFPMPLGQTGTPTTSFGNTARVVIWEIFGFSAVLTNIWHSFSVTYIPQAELQRGRIIDWTDLGHPYDKRMSTVTLEYNVGTANVDLLLDYIYSKDGDTTYLGAQTFSLGGGVGTDRALQTFPIIDGVVAKMVRLRPKVQTAQYQIFGDPIWAFDKYPADIVYFTDYSDYGYEYEKRFYVLYLNVDTNGIDVSVIIEGDGVTKQTVTVNGTAANRMQSIAVNVDILAKLVRLKVVTPLGTGAKFQLFDHKFDFEKLPAPIVLSTPWTDHGYDFDKYAQQLSFDVNTNGTDVPVKFYADGQLKQTVIINATQSDRNINITLNPSLTCKQTRLEVDPTLIPPGGRFQLWGYNLVWQPADKGAVWHTYDWDDCGHPYDKKFVEMTFEYETQANSIQIGIDTLTGINGTTETLLVKTFSIQTTSTGRGKAVIPMTANDGSEIIAKMLRVRSTGIAGGGSNNPDFKMWNVKFPGMIPYPPDIVPFTDWTYGDSTCDKIFRSLRLQIDTGGVACVVHLDVDGQEDLETWTITTTSDDRAVVLSPDQSGEIIGKMFRLRFTPGTNGKAQLFGDPTWDLVKDACEFVFFDSFEQAFGSVGYTIIYQAWIDYKCAGSLEIKFFNEDGELFYTKTLPPHSYRYPERFYLPVQNDGVNNKSKKHRVTLEAVDHNLPFKLYRDSTRMECLNLSATQREGYFQNIIWEKIGIAV